MESFVTQLIRNRVVIECLYVWSTCAHFFQNECLRHKSMAFYNIARFFISILSSFFNHQWKTYIMVFAVEIDDRPYHHRFNSDFTQYVLVNEWIRQYRNFVRKKNLASTFSEESNLESTIKMQNYHINNDVLITEKPHSKIINSDAQSKQEKLR